ncbi:BufA2 family periplasmic bufferin-type metallophore [Cupriavidus basilensis]|jgi:uncharacterized membrane protein|uniref:BufA2 family periplasmic bufferin-type metallophore n=1 Tax=Cupriavidus TaxID=106589 RepID=UPI00044C64D0|nr:MULTISPECIES: hypothetical protein [Cupriavidus]KDP88272.1 hypothetical protein CF70_031570 [Cupriavidus sp. SK-3]KJK20800.1 hypothetical protein UB46_30920 [Burkholderiaceae bacterium 16]MDF3884028.1 hypothetical protein [Cupriavidus basilensis]
MNMTKKSRATLAAAAALVALSSLSIMAPARAAGSDEPGRCYGVNSCKGTSLCATASNDCAGLNDCKGKGVLVKPASVCLKEGGTLAEPK